MLQSIIAISVGAAVGAVSRWLLALGLNAIWAAMPLGTLAANLIGGYLVGLAVAYFGNNPQLSPEWKLLVVTGFLGGLTTFSSFSAEVVGFIQRGEFTWALGTAMLHLVGSLVLTFLGILTYQALK